MELPPNIIVCSAIYLGFGVEFLQQSLKHVGLMRCHKIDLIEINVGLSLKQA